MGCPDANCAPIDPGIGGCCISAFAIICGRCPIPICIGGGPPGDPAVMLVHGDCGVPLGTGAGGVLPALAYIPIPGILPRVPGIGRPNPPGIIPLGISFS